MHTKGSRCGGCPLRACRKTCWVFRQSLLPDTARARCPLEADNEHTCVLYCILRRVHAPPQNRFDFICRRRGKLCEAFLTRCELPRRAALCIMRSQRSSITEGCLRQVSRLTMTSASRQAMAPGTAAPSPKGCPMSFQPTHTTNPAAIPEMIPAEVAFFQNRAANAGSPAAAA